MTKSELRFSRVSKYLLVLFLGIPSFSDATVFMSEVAWMGSSESANHEWIELTNDGPAQNVDGWILQDAQNLSIQLQGTVPANSSVVLERTSEASAQGTAFLIYTGALVNTGTTLQLRDANGNLVDQVSGGEDWQSIGGDNTTKETAQYTTKGWVTAKATPGVYASAILSEQEQEQEEEEEEEKATVTKVSSKTASKTKTNETVRLELPDVTLQLAVDAQTKGYVNQPIAFSVEPSGIGESLLDSLEYQWNFGDGLTARQKEPTHVFVFPGTYVVTVVGEYKRQKQVARHEITILPVAISLTKNSAGDVQVNNDSPYEIDISHYLVRGETDFVFPAYSILLPNQTVTLPKGFVSTSFEPMIAVYDTEKKFVAGALPKTYKTPRSPETFVYQSPPAGQIRSLSSSRQSALREENVVFPEKTDESISPQQESVSAPLLTASAVQALPQSERFTYVALCIVLMLGIFGVYAKPRRNETD